LQVSSLADAGLNRGNTGGRQRSGFDLDQLREKKNISQHMDEAKDIVRLNIERYKRLLACETDPDERRALNRRLAEQEAKLQEMERKERG
jgi:hypothetical protein